MRPTKIGDTVRYIGPGEGQGELHLVVMFLDGEVITIAQGHSWLGDPATFAKHFQFVQAA